MLARLFSVLLIFGGIGLVAFSAMYEGIVKDKLEEALLDALVLEQSDVDRQETFKKGWKGR